MDALVLPPVKFLLVDDLADNLLVLSALLARDDVEILTAQSGAEALELLLVHDVALAFLDVQMPEMDGFELAELLRGSERTRHIPLIFVTAGMREQTRMFRGYQSGAVDFIYKPIEPHILQNKAEVFFRLYRQRQQLALELQERTETLRWNEMFSALLAHDLRSPLSAILASAELLQRRSSDAAATEMAARIAKSGNRMARLIEDMLDLARARLGGGIAVKPQPTDLASLAEPLVREQQLAAPQRTIEWCCSGDTSGHWDPERVSQVIANLLGNALKHGDSQRAIAVTLDGNAPDRVNFSVSNGGTIPPALVPHLFDAFRGRRHEGRHDGLGLGLYIVAQIVAAHHGTVALAPSPEGETCFRVTLPRHVSG